MADTMRIRAQMDVVGSDGRHVGTVDHVQGNHIKLADSDPAAAGEHRYLSAAHVRAVGERVELDCPADEVHRAWRSERGGARGDGNRDGSRDGTGMR